MLKKMVVYSAIFEVPTNINAECINIITIFKSPKEYTCILENTLISSMLKAEAVKKFGLPDTTFEKNSRKLNGKQASLIC